MRSLTDPNLQVREVVRGMPHGLMQAWPHGLNSCIICHICHSLSRRDCAACIRLVMKRTCADFFFRGVGDASIRTPYCWCALSCCLLSNKSPHGTVQAFLEILPLPLGRPTDRAAIPSFAGSVGRSTSTHEADGLGHSGLDSRACQWWPHVPLGGFERPVDPKADMASSLSSRTAGVHLAFFCPCGFAWGWRPVKSPFQTYNHLCIGRL